MASNQVVSNSVSKFVPAQQPQCTASKAGPSTGSTQRRTTSGGWQSSNRKGEPGCPVGVDAAVMPSCTPERLQKSHAVVSSASFQATVNPVEEHVQQQFTDSCTTTMYKQQQQQQQLMKQFPGAPPSTPATAMASSSKHNSEVFKPAPAHAAGDLGCVEDSSMYDLEELFEEAEDAVDAFFRHPSNPEAAKLFGADISDALARLISANNLSAGVHAPARAAPWEAAEAAPVATTACASPAMIPAKVAAAEQPQQAPSRKLGVLGSLGIGSMALGFGRQQQQQHQHQQQHEGQAGRKPDAAPPVSIQSLQHLTGAKRSKPSFTMSRDPEADRPHCRREVDCTAACEGATDAAAVTASQSTAAQKPHPPTTAAYPAGGLRTAARCGRRFWGLDLSDSGMASTRPSPFASVTPQQDEFIHCAAVSPSTPVCQSGNSSAVPQAEHDTDMPDTSTATPAAQAFDGRVAVARRCSCPGVSLAGLSLTEGHLQAPGAAGAVPCGTAKGLDASAGLVPHEAAALQTGSTQGRTAVCLQRRNLRVLDLTAPADAQEDGDDVAATRHPQLSPGTASSSALAAAVTAGVVAQVDGVHTGGAFSSASQGTAVAAAGNAPAGAAGEASKAENSSLQSKRSVGGAATVVKPRRSKHHSNSTAEAGQQVGPEGSGAATAASDSPPAVFVTITSASGQGPQQQSLTRKVSSRSAGSPGSQDAAMDLDGAVCSEQLATACAAAAAAVAAEQAGNRSSYQLQPLQQLLQQPDDLSRLPPIRTKSRTEGPAAVINPSATGTAALSAMAMQLEDASLAAGGATANRDATAMRSATTSSGPSRESLAERILQQQLILQQQGILPNTRPPALVNDTLASAATVNSSQAGVEHSTTLPKVVMAEHPQTVTPTVTPTTAHAASSLLPAAPSPGLLLSAAAASVAAAVTAGPRDASAPLQHNTGSGTPGGIASSIAQMTLQSSHHTQQGGLHSTQQPALRNTSLPSPFQQPSCGKSALNGAAQQQPVQQSPQAQLPWQHLPASACNGVAVFPGDSGLVMMTGRTITTGLIKLPAAGSQRPGSSITGCPAAATGGVDVSFGISLRAPAFTNNTQSSSQQAQMNEKYLCGDVPTVSNLTMPTVLNMAVPAAGRRSCFGGATQLVGFNTAPTAQQAAARRLSAPQVPTYMGPAVDTGLAAWSQQEIAVPAAAAAASTVPLPAVVMPAAPNFTPAEVCWPTGQTLGVPQSALSAFALCEAGDLMPEADCGGGVEFDLAEGWNSEDLLAPSGIVTGREEGLQQLVQGQLQDPASSAQLHEMFDSFLS